MKTIIIGVAGGSGSGKTTLAQNLQKEFQDDILLLSHDFYYKRHDELSFDERRKLNYDHPDAFDTSLLIEHLKELKKAILLNIQFILLSIIIEKILLLKLNLKRL